MEFETEWARAGGRELDAVIPRPTCLTGGLPEAGDAPRGGIFVDADDFRRRAGGTASATPADCS
eukprot:1568858-Alexandrium_andersonii.AAC.1